MHQRIYNLSEILNQINKFQQRSPGIFLLTQTAKVYLTLHILPPLTSSWGKLITLLVFQYNFFPTTYFWEIYGIFLH